MGKNRVKEILRVNHAGELGAIQIYKGQLAVLKNKSVSKEIKKMLNQEIRHYETFCNILLERNIRPSLLSPIWKTGGFGIGVVTAVLGKDATMACTEAVEEVIVKHYEKQTEYLKNGKNDLYKITSQFAKEEKEHMDMAGKIKNTDNLGIKMLKFGIKSLSKIAIKVAEKV